MPGYFVGNQVDRGRGQARIQGPGAYRQRRRDRGGHWGHVPPPPHFSPQSMKCPTSTGVHARPTMYQEGVPRGAIKNRQTWEIAPRTINPEMNDDKFFGKV